MTSLIYNIGRKLLSDSQKKKAFNLYFNIVNLVKYRTTDMFYMIEFQTITTCNRRCHFCPVSKAPLQPKVMPMKIIEKLVNELKELNYEGWFSPHLYGEPLLDNRLSDILKLSRKHIPKAHNIIYSNGDMLTVTRFRELVDSGADLFNISQYDPVMPKSIQRLFNALTDKEKRLIKYRIVNDDSYLSNRGGLVKPKKQALGSECPTNSVFIDAQGKVVLCSNDYFSESVMGDLFEEKLIDIWYKTTYKKLRKELKSHFYSLDMCKRCRQIEPVFKK
jgi:cyclic pyranopterin phosphate synthase